MVLSDSLKLPSPSLSAAAAVVDDCDSEDHPTCQNCFTVKTPLWRRDEHGTVLCNACGLFLKLHGEPRPISLKTDTIKSRNRKKLNNNATNNASSNSNTHTNDPNKIFKRKKRLLTTGGGSLPSNNPKVSILEKFMVSGSIKPLLKPKEALPSAKDYPMQRGKYSLEPSEPSGKNYLYQINGSDIYTSNIELTRLPTLSTLLDPSPFSDPTIPEIELTWKLHNEEEVIKLKTKISELELVTDLYKKHIFQLNEKCKQLEVELHSRAPIQPRPRH
ncbi:hypothetical protein SEUBUCD646_0K02520 [Saccharomyces eubayanus]|uniref:GATA-type domain-containing protein n=1 Tax=Saccharomyces eubayanus TaxID=1080349 RepID=A0ABN8VDF3_SACEU|nr:hypothetical protein SEUBUCD650_0K02510 [Saccharomyces eubayanus]CAI1576713.1 hypothetical protein SEUBUCD646_0K02520 [Saccharomyces eubayanus]